MRHALPDNDAWLARFKDLRSWVAANGRLPESNPEGGPEDTLRTWLERQHANYRSGDLAENLATILKMIPGAGVPRGGAALTDRPKAPPMRRGMGRVQQMEDFYRTHGRLPKFKGSAPGEASLYSYLNSTARVQFRKNELSPEVHRRLSKIPGVLVSIRRRPESAEPAAPTERALRVNRVDPRLEELIAFREKEGRLPKAGRPAPEPALHGYLYRRLRPAYAAGTLNEATLRRLETAPPYLATAQPARTREGFGEAA